MNDIALTIAVGAIPLWLNVKASLLICRDSFSEKPQKTAQLLFVWLVPLVGAIMVLGVHRRGEKSSRVHASNECPEDDIENFHDPSQPTKEAVDDD